MKTDRSNVIRGWKLLFSPSGAAKVLLSAISILSAVSGLVEVWRQHTASLVATYQTEDVVLPAPMVPPTPAQYGSIKFADFVPKSNAISPKTTLTRLDIENKRDVVAQNIEIQMPDVSRFLYATGYTTQPEKSFFSDQLKINHSTTTLELYLTGIPDLAPGAKASVFIWADSFAFGFMPAKVRSVQGAARIDSGTYVTGVARVFAYCMIWFIVATMCLLLWQFWEWVRTKI